MGIFTEFFKNIKETETTENKNLIIPFYGNEDVIDESTITWTSMNDVMEYHVDETDHFALTLYGTGPVEPTNDIKLTIEKIVSIMREDGELFYFRENSHKLEIGSQASDSILRLKLSI